MFCFASRQGLFHPSQADLELTVQPRLASDSQQSDAMASHTLAYRCVTVTDRL